MSLLARVGQAFLALAGQKTGNWPFDRVPLLGAPTSSPVTQPYAQSVWVQRAIKEISGPIAAVELKFYDEGDNEITAAPWLPFWRQPCRNLSQADFIEALTGWLKLSGEAFIILPDEFAAPFPDAQTKWPPLFLARPDCMRAIKSASGELQAWHYQLGGRSYTFPLDQVIQPRYWNPYDEIHGMSEYEAARVATEADYAAGTFALNLSRANGDTGMIVTLKNGVTLDDTQQKQITDSLRLKQQRSQRGEFASVFVPADLEVQDPKVRAPDAQFTAQRLGNRHEIYVAFGVPPSMADVVASYSVGSASDWYRLITGTCQPTAAKIADAVGAVATRMHGRPVTAYFEFDDHPVMQQVRSERIEAGTKLWDRGVPWADVSEYLDLDLPRFDGDDTGYISFGLAPIGEAAAVPDPAADPALADEAPADAIAEAIRALRARRRRALAPPACDCCEINFADLAFRAGDSHDVKLWKSHAAKRRETIRAFETKFNRVLMLARAEVLAKLERAATQLSTPPLSTRAAAADFIFDLKAFGEKFTATMRSTSLNALQTAGEQLFKEVGKDDPWSMPSHEAVRFLQARENALANVPQDVFERIRGALTEGLTNGDPLKDIAAAVRQEFNAISKGRAMVIASTETSAAYGKGRDEAMKAAGVQFKQWLVSGNSNIRPAHQAMAGATVPVDQKFLVLNPKTGESDTVAYPGDTSGAPWNVINCHCVAISVPPPEDPAT